MLTLTHPVTICIGNHDCAAMLHCEVDPVDGTALVRTATLDGVIEVSRDDLVQMAGASVVLAAEAMAAQVPA